MFRSKHCQIVAQPHVYGENPEFVLFEKKKFFGKSFKLTQIEFWNSSASSKQSISRCTCARGKGDLSIICMHMKKGLQWPVRFVL